MDGNLPAGWTGVLEAGAAEARAELLITQQALIPTQPALPCPDPDTLPIPEKVRALQEEGWTEKQLSTPPRRPRQLPPRAL